ncbi:MAG: hypothetical protein AAFU66_05910 [Pseudomonadota bacterium]
MINGTSVSLVVDEDNINGNRTHAGDYAGIIAFDRPFHAVFEAMVTASKTVSVVADPLGTATSPYALPGSRVRYIISASNAGNLQADEDSIVLTDAIPPNMVLVVSDIASAGSGPVLFSDASPSSGLGYTLPLVDILWARERDLEPLDTPERQAGLEARLNSAANAIEHSVVKAAYTQALRNRARDYFWALRREGRGTPARGPGPTGGPLKSDCNAAGLGNILQVLDNPGLLDLGREELALANFADQDVNAIRDAILDLSDYESEVDQTSVHRHLVTTGNTRAAQLLTSFTRKPHIDPDGHKAREWLTALERFAADDDSGAAEAAVDEGEAEWADTWRRLHQRTAERRAYRARLNEAAEKSDQS